MYCDILNIMYEEFEFVEISWPALICCSLLFASSAAKVSAASDPPPPAGDDTGGRPDRARRRAAVPGTLPVAVVAADEHSRRASLERRFGTQFS